MNYFKTGSASRPPVRPKPAAVICGSFRRNPEALRRDFLALQEAGCSILSPPDLDFVRETDGFVFGESDQDKTISAVEEFHLRSMEEADLIWLHCPGGYVGTSAAMELGYANALGLRIFAAEQPTDAVLASMIEPCASPAAAAEAVNMNLGPAPSHGFAALQSYYARAADRRGWSTESSEAILALLKGELEELEEALAEPSGSDAASLELADVQLYIVHLANALSVDIGEAVGAKERLNAIRFEVHPEQAAA